MSELLIEELLTGEELKQEILVGDNNINTVYIRAHLYKHGHPPGGMTIQVRDLNDKLIGESSTVTVADIDTDISSVDFFHGDVRFSITTPLRASTGYYIVLKANGSYVFNETAGGSTGYIGLSKDYDLRKVDADYTPSVGVESAFLLDIWSRGVKTR